jgi:hypothetical protein
MSRLLMKQSFFFNFNKATGCLSTASLLLQQPSVRSIHRNHPGHKPKPAAIPRKYELPDNYLEEALYPPVKPQLPPGHWPENYDPKVAWRYFSDGQKFHSLKTIQERLAVQAYMNVQQTIDDLGQVKTRYFPIFQVSAMYNSPRLLPFHQYITKTHVEAVEDLVTQRSGKILFTIIS